MDYDVVIVGARVAGASTGMLLARAGLRVLVLDRDRFPSDTLSSHQIQLPGVACLHRWGLLDRVIASDAPATRSALLAPGAVRLAGRYPEYQGVDAMISPRRSVLDAILVAAAREAGADVIEGFAVDGLRYDGDRVTGVRGVFKGGLPAEFTCRLVVGADGKHSHVAAWAGARSYRVRTSRTAMFYTYLSGPRGERGEMYVQPDHVAGYWPTNDGLTVAFLAIPLSRFAELRSDLDRHFRDVARLHLGERACGLERAERFRGTPDLPNEFRVPYGPGWALVGDAGLVMDPITGQGIGNAMTDAERLSHAIVAGYGDSTPKRSLRIFHRSRDQRRRAMYEMTSDFSSFRPNRRLDALFRVMAERRIGVDRLLSVLTGAIGPNEFFSPVQMMRLLGFRDTLRVARGDRAA